MLIFNYSFIRDQGQWLGPKGGLVRGNLQFSDLMGRRWKDRAAGGLLCLVMKSKLLVLIMDIAAHVLPVALGEVYCSARSLF